jgi:7-cyano-7-deazaguanine synthase
LNIVAIVSGGMDSVTMAHLLASQGNRLHLLSFDYGQRHLRETYYASLCAKRLEVPWHSVDMREVGLHLSGSALTDIAIPVPEGHYTHESMRSTVVPNRNMIMLSVAAGLAVAERASRIATAVHAGDHAIYPDCRRRFIDAMTVALRLGNEGYAHPELQVLAPFVRKTKADIVTIGDGLGVPWDQTWSCYRGEQHHCGRCGTCVERREAFELARVIDPTAYELEA